MKTDRLIITRREFLVLGGSRLAAWPLAGRPSSIALAAEGDTDVFARVFLRGGLDGLSAVIPLFEGEYHRQRPTLATPAPRSGDDRTALELDGRFGLHPALSPLVELWDAGALAIVHAAGSPDPTHSHFDAMDCMERGTPGDKTTSTGWLARHLATSAVQHQAATTPVQDNSFRAVGLSGVLPTSLHGPVAVTTMHTIADFSLRGDAQEQDRVKQVLSELYAQDEWLADYARRTFDAVAQLASLTESQYTPEHGAVYPKTEKVSPVSQSAPTMLHIAFSESGCMTEKLRSRFHCTCCLVHPKPRSWTAFTMSPRVWSSVCAWTP